MAGPQKFYIRMILRGPGTNDSGGSQVVNRFKWNNGCAAKMGSTVGFWLTSIRCGTTRDALFAGMRRESISRTANKLKRESKKKMLRCEMKSTALRCLRKSLVRRKRCARYWRKPQKWRRWIRRFSFWVRRGRARSLSLGPFTSDRNDQLELLFASIARPSLLR